MLGIMRSGSLSNIGRKCLVLAPSSRSSIHAEESRMDAFMWVGAADSKLAVWFPLKFQGLVRFQKPHKLIWSEDGIEFDMAILGGDGKALSRF